MRRSHIILFGTLDTRIPARDSLLTGGRREKRGAMSIGVLMAVVRCKKTEKMRYVRTERKILVSRQDCSQSARRIPVRARRLLLPRILLFNGY